MGRGALRGQKVPAAAPSNSKYNTPSSKGHRPGLGEAPGNAVGQWGQAGPWLVEEARLDQGTLGSDHRGATGHTRSRRSLTLGLWAGHYSCCLGTSRT